MMTLRKARSATPRGLEPAASIVAKLGGTYKVAEILDAYPARVSSWKQPATSPHHGGGGRIPQRYQSLLLEYAKRNGIALTPVDFQLPPSKRS